MKRLYIFIAASMAATTVFGQSALDAFQVSQSDLKGTARFMSMAGAFGALGGDLSTLTQNPGGIGVYRGSDIGVTVDLNFQSAKTHAEEVRGATESRNQTKFNCNNFGYIGTASLPSEVMPFFNWGASYTRAKSFDRVYSGSYRQLNGSLTNYIANYTNQSQLSAAELDQAGKDNYPYNTCPWMSTLFYNNFLINQPVSGAAFEGLFQSGTLADGKFSVREKGYVDEYSINFGGNLMNVVYWGIGFGITDLNYTIDTYYNENFTTNAMVPVQNATTQVVDQIQPGYGFYELNSWKHISGTGFNFKAGVIVKPINEVRIGLAVHTPTYYNMTQEGWAGVQYDFQGTGLPDNTAVYNYDYYDPYTVTNDGVNDYWTYKLKTPWRLIASAAGVIGGRFILSADYEYRAYNDMNLKDNNGDNLFYSNNDIKNYYKATNTLRLGAEFRVSPQFSLRAGYSYETSPATARANNNETIDTFGDDPTETTPSYTFDNNTQYITCGLGYRYKGFYVDAAYVHKYRSSTFHAFTTDGTGGDNGFVNDAPYSSLSCRDNQVVLSLGYKF